jgi:HAD superfamily hydrolase (TIGR01549 family)
MTLTIRHPTPLLARPACVVFDTDNTLYPYQPSHEKAMHAARQKAVRVLGITEAEFDSAFAEARRQTKVRLKGTASSHSRLLYFQRMLELLGLRTQVIMALDFEQTYWRTFLTNSQLFEEVTDFLDDLRHAGIPTAIITDLTAQIQFRKIVYWALDQYFDHVVTSEEAGFDKPNHAPFDVAREKLGNAGGPLWMIGDDPVCDIQGARRCIGAVTLQKRHQGVRILEGEAGPDAVFDHFGELRAFLARLPETGRERARVAVDDEHSTIDPHLQAGLA